jgi:hypothetical protein
MKPYFLLHHCQGNGLVGQVEIPPEILLIYRIHLVMIVHKISAAGMLSKGAKNCSKVECVVQIRATMHDSNAPSSGVVFHSALK